MISFVIPFSTKSDNLANWPSTDNSLIILSTILCIKNINKVINCKKEIILVDNTNNFPDVKMENLKIVKGFQNYTKSEIEEKKLNIKYKIRDYTNHTCWASTAYNIGIEHCSGDYIVLQHNDIFYHTDVMMNLIEDLKTNEYISVDSKKLSLTGYFNNKETIDSLNLKFKISHEDGGYIKCKDFGLSDAYFFITKKEFFKDYDVDWNYGDTNHGATIKCLKQNKNFIHLKPYFDNPSYDTKNEQRTYKYLGKDFVTHLKGGFSEHKFSHKIHEHVNNMNDVNLYLTQLIKTL